MNTCRIGLKLVEATNFEQEVIPALKNALQGVVNGSGKELLFIHTGCACGGESVFVGETKIGQIIQSEEKIEPLREHIFRALANLRKLDENSIEWKCWQVMQSFKSPTILH